MIVITGKELVKFCESKIGTNYVYGMKGIIMSKAKYKQLQQQYGSKLVWDSDASKIGTICIDCSGLIQWATGVAKSSTALKNAAKEVYDISTISEAPVGVILWKQGHVGVYIGDGWCVEAKGSKDNTCKTKVSSTKWEKWLIMDYIQYDKVEPEPPEGEKYIVTAAQSLYVRKGAGSQYGIVKTIHKDDIVIVSKTENSWAYMPQEKGWSSLSYLKKISDGSGGEPVEPGEPLYEVGDIVLVKGKLWTNPSGGNFAEYSGNMKILSISESRKYPYEMAKPNNITRFGYTDKLTIIKKI